MSVLYLCLLKSYLTFKVKIKFHLLNEVFSNSSCKEELLPSLCTLALYISLLHTVFCTLHYRCGHESFLN